MVSVLGCVGLIVIGMQPPNEKAVYVVGGMTACLAVFWFVCARHTFAGPPHGVIGMRHHHSVHEGDQPDDDVPAA